jgi:hypothetical protein
MWKEGALARPAASECGATGALARQATSANRA